jgi:WD40 repeat protein
MDGSPVAVVGRQEGSVEVWDLASNVRTVHWKAAGGPIDQVGLANTDQGPILVATHTNTMLSMYESVTGRTTSIDTSTEEQDSITALLVTQHKGEWLVVSAHISLGLTIRTLPDFAIKAHVEKATKGAVYALCGVRVGGCDLLMSGGDNLNRFGMSPLEEPSRDDSILRLWSLDDLSLIWKDQRGFDRGWVERIVAAKWGDKTYALVTGIHAYEIWDLDSKTVMGGDAVPHHPYFWFYPYHDKQLFLSHNDSRFWVNEAQIINEGLSLTPLHAPRNVPASHFGEVVRIGKTDFLLGASANVLRIWDVKELIEETNSPEPDRRMRVYSLVSSNAGICAGAGTELVLLDANTGVEIATASLPADSQRPAIAKAVQWDERMARFIVGTDRGKILSWNPDDPLSTVELFDLPTTIDRLRLCEWGEQTLAITTGGGLGLDESARVWDLESRKELFTDRAFRLHHGEEDKPLYGLAVAAVDGDVKFAFAGKYGKVMVSRFSAKPHGYKDYEEWYLPVPSTGGSYTTVLETVIDNGTPLLIGATDDALLVVWDFATGKVVAKRAGVHRGSVDALATHVQSNGRAMIASGGSDGFLRVWKLDLEQVVEIDLGDPVSDLAWTSQHAIAVGTHRGVLAVRLGDGIVSKESV